MARLYLFSIRQLLELYDACTKAEDKLVARLYWVCQCDLGLLRSTSKDIVSATRGEFCSNFHSNFSKLYRSKLYHLAAALSGVEHQSTILIGDITGEDRRYVVSEGEIFEFYRCYLHSVEKASPGSGQGVDKWTLSYVEILGGGCVH